MRLRLRDDMFACREVFNSINWVNDAKPDMLRLREETLACRLVRLVFRELTLALRADKLRLRSEILVCSEVLSPISCVIEIELRFREEILA